MTEAQIDSPGTVNDFARERGLDPRDALPEYSAALGAWRAQQLGEGATAVASKDIKPEIQEED